MTTVPWNVYAIRVDTDTVEWRATRKPLRVWVSKLSKSTTLTKYVYNERKSNEAERTVYDEVTLPHTLKLEQRRYVGGRILGRSNYHDGYMRIIRTWYGGVVPFDWLLKTQGCKAVLPPHRDTVLNRTWRKANGIV